MTWPSEHAAHLRNSRMRKSTIDGFVFPLPDATVLPDLDKNGFDRDGWRRPSSLLVPDGRCDAVAGFRHNRRFAASRRHSGSSTFFP
jgi:hypothetical protein